MATNNISGSVEKGCEDLCTVYPEERVPLMSAEEHRLAKKRRHVRDDVLTAFDSEVLSHRPKSDIPHVDVKKLREERDKKYQSQPLDLDFNYPPVDVESLKRDQIKKSSPDSPQIDVSGSKEDREERHINFKSHPIEMSNPWYPGMDEEGGYQSRAPLRTGPSGDRMQYQSMPPLDIDGGYQPGPLRREDSPRRDRSRQYQSGPPVDTRAEPPMDYDGRYLPEGDRRENVPGPSRNDGYYRGPQGDGQREDRRMNQDYNVDFNRNDKKNNNISGRTTVELSEVFPHINSSDGKGTLIRHRRKSSRKMGFGEPDYDDEDDKTLPSQKAIQRNRTKSIKERRMELEEEKKAHPRPKSLAEKYNELLKNKGNLTPGDVATIVRESTLTRMNNMASGAESKEWHKFKLKKKEFLDRFTIWAGTLKEVEGQYGTAVMTYFRFIKWLMFLNIYIMIIMFCVITVPFLALGPYNFNSSLSDVNVSGYKDAIICTTEYEVYHKNLTDSETIGQKVLDFLQGTGWMERKILFYGVYYNKTYTSDNKTHTYHMGLAYMLAFGGCFLISFFLIVKNAAKNVKVSLGTQDTVAMYCNKTFSGWDFCINNKRAAKVKRKNIFTDIKAELNDQRKEWEREHRTTAELAKLYLLRILINVMVLALLGGALYLIAFTTEQMIELQNRRNLSEILELVVQYVPFVTITVLNAVLPIIFQKLVQFEDYRYEFGFKLTLARAILLRLASPIALIAILYKELIERPEDDSDTGKCGNKQWESDSSRGRIMCWETYFGQQLYKLVLLDLVVETGIIFFMQVPRWYMYKKYGNSSKFVKLVGPQEFDLPQSVVDIIYTQSICWLGMFFSPLIPFMTFVKCALFFWVKKFAVLKINVPQERPFKTSGSNSLFMLVLLLSFIISAGLLGYMIGSIPPSQSCGPFRVYSTNQTDAVMFDVISKTVSSWPTEARDVFEFLGTVGFFLPVVVLLVLLMYYYWLRGQGYKKTEELLQNQLKMEGRDKKYLLDRVNEVVRLNSDLLS